MQYSKRGRPTVGVLAGWQMYGSATPHSFLDSVLRGIHSAALDRNCNLLLACGTATIGPLTTRPAWPIPAPDADFLPVGPWNTDGLLVVNPLLSEARSRYVHNLLAKGFPIVLIGTAQGGPAVGIDNEGGIRQAMVHPNGKPSFRILRQTSMLSPPNQWEPGVDARRYRTAWHEPAIPGKGGVEKQSKGISTVVSREGSLSVQVRNR